MNMATATSEERRRRIAEKGSDRMAFITGRIQNLPPSPPPSPSYAHKHLSSRTGPLTPSLLSKNNPLNAIPELKADGSDSDSAVHNRETGAKGSSVSACDNANKKQNPQTKGLEMAKAVIEQHLPNLVKQLPLNFSSRQINSCIITSEPTRACSALAIAVLVVFSHMVRMQSFAASRPLYMVLLSDITIVLAQLYRDKERGCTEEAEAVKGAPQEDGQNWGGAVVLLERGLVAYQAIRGFFIDFSIYVVVVVCGTSLF